jgi:outer membrane lipoprotein
MITDQSTAAHIGQAWSQMGMMAPIQTGVKHGPSDHKACIWKGAFTFQIEIKENARYNRKKKLQVSRREEMKAKKLFLSLIVLLLMGCAAVISQDVMKDVDKDLPFQAVLRNPDNFKGKTILLGGKIIETTPSQGKTRVTVLQYPLGFGNRPSVDAGSEGRFIVEAPGFLDPVVYSAGRQVTVAGIVDGKQVHPLGEISYTYPIVANRELYLWSADDALYVPPPFYIGIGIGIGKTF